MVLKGGEKHQTIYSYIKYVKFVGRGCLRKLWGERVILVLRFGKEQETGDSYIKFVQIVC